jgi:transcriptional regulator with XRE-family HTH domain
MPGKMPTTKAPTKKERGAPPPEEMLELPRRLRAVYEARKRNGLRQEKLAEASGLSQAVISDLMSEPLTKGMTVAALSRVAKALNVSIDYLVMGVGDEAPKLHRSPEPLPLPPAKRSLRESEIPPMFQEPEPAPPPQSKPVRNKER